LHKYCVSVIIPVFNAAKYLRRAVESALGQPEVAEILIIDDASMDESLALSRRLAFLDSRIRVLQHDDGRNHGVGATRNVGIIKASSEWIAFLDADDFFLPQRFAQTKEVIGVDDGVDAVFEATGVHYYSDAAAQRYFRRGEVLTTLSRRIEPEMMFENYSPLGLAGYVVPTGVVVRKAAILSIGMFDERIRVHEDTATFIRLAAKCRVATGEIEKPVAMRGAHEGRHLSDHATRRHAYISRLLMWNFLYPWARQELSGSRLQLLKSVMGREVGVCYANGNCRLRGRIQAIRQILLVACTSPRLLSVDSVLLAFLNTLKRP